MKIYSKNKLRTISMLVFALSLTLFANASFAQAVKSDKPTIEFEDTYFPVKAGTSWLYAFTSPTNTVDNGKSELFHFQIRNSKLLVGGAIDLQMVTMTPDGRSPVNHYRVMKDKVYYQGYATDSESDKCLYTEPILLLDTNLKPGVEVKSETKDNSLEPTKTFITAKLTQFLEKQPTTSRGDVDTIHCHLITETRKSATSLEGKWSRVEDFWFEKGRGLRRYEVIEIGRNLFQWKYLVKGMNPAKKAIGLVPTVKEMAAMSELAGTAKLLPTSNFYSPTPGNFWRYQFDGGFNYYYQNLALSNKNGKFLVRQSFTTVKHISGDVPWNVYEFQLSPNEIMVSDFGNDSFDLTPLELSGIVLKLPIEKGKEWKFEDKIVRKAHPMPSTTSYICLGKETVEVSAGKFEAFHIQETRTQHNSEGVDTSMAFDRWYAPKVGLIKSSYKNESGDEKVTELMEYSIK